MSVLTVKIGVVQILHVLIVVAVIAAPVSQVIPLLFPEMHAKVRK